jgi:hypothetical protein
MSEQTEGAEVEALDERTMRQWDAEARERCEFNEWGDRISWRERYLALAADRAAAEARGAKVVLNALADRLDFWDGRPWEGEESTNDILTFCERAFAAAARGVEGGA